MRGCDEHWEYNSHCDGCDRNHREQRDSQLLHESSKNTEQTMREIADGIAGQGKMMIEMLEIMKKIINKDTK